MKTPLIFFNANNPGSGKTALAKLGMEPLHDKIPPCRGATLPPPLKYRTRSLNDLMRKATPENIDRETASLRDFESREIHPLIVRLATATAVEALRVRRDQFERAGLLAPLSDH